MASATRQKPVTAAEADHQHAENSARLAERRIKPLTRNSLYPIGYGLGALILVTVGFLLFSDNRDTTPDFPTVAETVPSPDINSTVAPPPADAPAANP